MWSRCQAQEIGSLYLGMGAERSRIAFLVRGRLEFSAPKSLFPPVVSQPKMACELGTPVTGHWHTLNCFTE